MPNQNQRSHHDTVQEQVVERCLKELVEDLAWLQLTVVEQKHETDQLERESALVRRKARASSLEHHMQVVKWKKRSINLWKKKYQQAVRGSKPNTTVQGKLKQQQT